MITILAEKPSVAREIARIVGAMKREEGYFTGNGYHVTWALGHLVQLALPDGYGIKGFRRDSLPVIPKNFELIPRQVKTDKGYKADAAAVKQIKVITKLWNESDGIIVATDCAREGELIFRYLYSYIGCTLPFQRLWISSLTDAAIRKGLKKLKDGREYDNLYQAAKARSEADWLVGINGTQALSVAAGRGTYSVGRVQTPTLTMVCQRFWENKRFQPEPVYQLHFTTPSVSVDEVVKFASVEKWKDKEEAAILYNKVKEQMAATVTKVEKREKIENPPLLYDLTTLQKKANTRHGFTAEQTLALVQKLYEAKLVTYPRTSSRYIPEDVFDEVPMLFDRLATHSSFAEKIGALDGLNRRSVDASKVTDHHALLVTPNRPLALYDEMMPLCADMTGVAKGLAGLGALFYVAVRVWQSLARAEAIDVYPLLRPFALGLCILFFPTIVLGTMNSVLSPIVQGVHGILEEQTFDMNEYREQKDKLEYEAMMRNPETAYLASDEEFDRQLDELGWSPSDLVTMTGMYMDRAAYNIKKTVRDWFRELLELMFAAAALIIDTLRTFFLVVLSILGPVAFAFAVWDGFHSTLSAWFSRYIQIYLWLPVSDLFSTILAKIQILMLQNDIQAMQTDPNFSVEASNGVYIVFLIIGIVGYFTIPTVAGWIIQAGGGIGSYNKNINTAGALGGSVAGAAAGNVAGRAGKLIKGTAGKLFRR